MRTASRATGTTSATRRSFSKPTTACAAGVGFRNARSIRRTRADPVRNRNSHDTRVALPSLGARPAAAPALSHLPQPGRAGVRRAAGRPCAISGRPLRSLRCADRLARATLRECTGRRLAFVSARAAVEYDEPVRRLVAAWKERGLRRLATLPPRSSRKPSRVQAALRRVRAGRSRSPAEARTPRRRAACSRAFRRLGATARAAPPPRQWLAASARAVAGRPPAQRRRRFRAELIAAPALVLVDDVYTTGSTAPRPHLHCEERCAHVEVVTFARAVRLES